MRQDKTYYGHEIPHGYVAYGDWRGNNRLDGLYGPPPRVPNLGDVEYVPSRRIPNDPMAILKNLVEDVKYGRGAMTNDELQQLDELSRQYIGEGISVGGGNFGKMSGRALAKVVDGIALGFIPDSFIDDLTGTNEYMSGAGAVDIGGDVLGSILLSIATAGAGGMLGKGVGKALGGALSKSGKFFGTRSAMRGVDALVKSGKSLDEIKALAAGSADELAGVVAKANAGRSVMTRNTPLFRTTAKDVRGVLSDADAMKYLDDLAGGMRPLESKWNQLTDEKMWRLGKAVGSAVPNLVSVDSEDKVHFDPVGLGVGIGTGVVGYKGLQYGDDVLKALGVIGKAAPVAGATTLADDAAKVIDDLVDATKKSPVDDVLKNIDEAEFNKLTDIGAKGTMAKDPMRLGKEYISLINNASDPARAMELKREALSNATESLGDLLRTGRVTEAYELAQELITHARNNGQATLANAIEIEARNLRLVD